MNANSKKKKEFRKKKGTRNMAKEVQRYGTCLGDIWITGNVVAPPALIIKLRYNVNFRFSDSGVSSCSASFNVNGLYDVDPLVGSTAIPGFVEWMSIYQTYQVISCRAHLKMINISTVSPIQTSCTWLQGSQAANTYFPTEYGNAWSTEGGASILGGMDTWSYDRKVFMAELNGTDAYWGTVDLFQGTSATNPLTVMQLVIGASSPTGSVVRPTVAGYLEFEARFSTPRLLTS